MAVHLEKEENDVVEHWQTLSGNLKADLVQMQQLTKLTRGKTGIYHVAISPRDNEVMSREQWNFAVEKIEKELGLTGQLRTMTYHEKKGRGHLHVCWSLVNQERGRLLDLKYDKMQLQEVAQELEQEFNHERTPRQTTEATKEITNADRMQEARTGLSAKDRKDLMTKLWQETENGKAFIEAVESEGYLIAKGDKAFAVVVDEKGGEHNLTRQLPKLVRAKQVREHLAGIDLRSIEDARAIQQEREKSAQMPRTLDELEEREAELEEFKTNALEAAQERFNAQLETFRETQAQEEAERLTRNTEGKPLTPEEEKQRKQRNLQKAETLKAMMEMFQRQYAAECKAIEEENRRAQARLVIAYDTQKIKQLEQERAARGKDRDGGREWEY